MSRQQRMKGLRWLTMYAFIVILACLVDDSVCYILPTSRLVKYTSVRTNNADRRALRVVGPTKPHNTPAKLYGAYSSYSPFQNSRSVRRIYLSPTIPKYPGSPFELRILDVTNGLVAINVAVYMLTLYRPSIMLALAKINDMMYYGNKNYLQFYRLLTACFAHASLVHIASNMFTLLNVGRTVEQIFGWQRYLLIYLLSGICANWMTYYWKISPVSLGASSGIYGLFGALAAHYFVGDDDMNSSRFGFNNIFRSIITAIVRSTMMGDSRQDHMAHIGGLMFGALFGVVLRPTPGSL